MSLFLFIVAIVLIIAGHIEKARRQKTLADLYEDVRLSIFSEGLAAGYLVNLVVPFRLGDVLRAFIVGRKMRNGFSFALATVIVDRILDVIVVGFAYIIIYLASPDASYDAGQSAYFYVLLSAVALALIALVTLARVGVKRAIRLFTGIFNEKIELTLMFLFWSVITAFRDIALNIRKSRLILQTLLMWGLYISSYYVISLVLSLMGESVSLMNVFSYLFSSSSIDRAVLFNDRTDTVMLVYLALSAVILFIVSFVRARMDKAERPMQTMMLLPQVHEADRRSFLENYFEGNRHAYVRGYLAANNDIQIIKDYSAGSNATTLLAIKDDRTIFRKYVVGADADKLHEQVEWIYKYRVRLPLPEIISEKRDDGMTLYDMPAVTGATGFFEYIHTNPLDQSFGILRKVCEALERGLYSDDGEPVETENVESADATEARAGLIDRYIDEKVEKNIRLIEDTHRLSELLRYDELIINGRSVKGFRYLKETMSKEKLKEVFAADRLSPIHGDVTVENIITVPASDDFGDGYYLIDPNTGNILDSKFIDYAKIMQSLHGGYEFLMRTERCSVSGNKIQFMSGMSRAYRDLYREYKKYLAEKFNEAELRSIRYHEIINWLRLMPYKIGHDEARAPIFLAGMLLAAEDIL